MANLQVGSSIGSSLQNVTDGTHASALQISNSEVAVNGTLYVSTEAALSSAHHMYFAGITDGNWRIGRSDPNDSNLPFPTSVITGARMSASIAGSYNEGFAIGQNGGTSILEIANVSNGTQARTMYINPDTAVGIGTASPNAQLQVNSSTSYQGMGALFVANSQGWPILFAADNGCVSIGNESPMATLDVRCGNTDGIDYGLFIGSGEGQPFFVVDNYGSVTMQYGNINMGRGFGIALQSPNGTARTLTLDDSGNIVLS